MRLVPLDELEPNRYEAFCTQFKIQSSTIERIAFRIVGNMADAQDVCQQAFAQGWASLDRYEPERGDLGGWLACIARARAIDLVRARRRRDRLGAGVAARHIEAEPALERVPFEFGQNRDRLIGLVRTLPPAHRRLLQLIYYEDFTHREVAQILEKPLGTIKTLVRQALLLLRARFHDDRYLAAACRSLPASADASERPFTTELIGEIGRPELEHSRAHRPPLERLTNVHVLFVDDDRNTRDMVTALLRRAGALCTTCHNVDDAVRALAALWPDVLVADIMMPGEDGYSLMRRVRAIGLSQERWLPAIAFTGAGREDQRAKALLAGFTAHLAKPVHPSVVVATVAQAVRKAA